MYFDIMSTTEQKQKFRRVQGTDRRQRHIARVEVRPSDEQKCREVDKASNHTSANFKTNNNGNTNNIWNNYMLIQ